MHAIYTMLRDTLHLYTLYDEDRKRASNDENFQRCFCRWRNIHLQNFRVSAKSGRGGGGKGGSCEDAYIESLIETVISINIDWKDGLHYHHGAQRL